MKEKQALYMLVLVSIIWGINFVVGKILTEQFSPIFLVAMRLLVTSCFLLIYAGSSMQLKKVSRKDFLLLAVIGTVGIFLNQMIFFYGLAYTTVANASLISALTPLATTLLAWMFLKEMVTSKKIVGAVLGIAGVAVLLTGGTHLSVAAINLGDLLTFVAMFLWSMAIIMIKKATARLDPLLITVYITVIGAVMMNMVNAWQWFSGKDTISIEPWAWVLLVSSAIVSQGIGFVLWNKGLSILGAGRSSMFMNIQPFVAIIVGFFVLRQPIYSAQIAGGAMIICGVILANRKRMEEITATANNSSVSR
ncbi:MAG: DMT family transporter [Bacillota bacterium]